MRAYSCDKCGFRCNETDTEWDVLNSTKECPNCSPRVIKKKKSEFRKNRILFGLLIITFSLLYFFNIIGEPSGSKTALLELIFETFGPVGLGSFFLAIGIYVVYSGINLK